MQTPARPVGVARLLWLLCLAVVVLVALPSTSPGQTPPAWTSTAGPVAPYPYSIKALAIDPGNPSVLYAGASVRAGIFKTTDGGGSWTLLSLPIELWINAIALDPGASNTVYTCTRISTGIYKTVDGGDTWNALGTDAAGCNALAVDGASHAVYAGTSAGAKKSTNGGTTWGTGTGLTRTVYSIAIDPLTPATVYAGTSGGGVYKTTNGGTTWTAANTDMTTATVRSLAVDPLTPAIVYAGTANGVYRSANGGDSWNGPAPGTASKTIYSIAIDPATPSVVYAAGTGGAYKSTDAGATWTPLDTGMTAGNAMVVDPLTHATVYLGGVGVARSTNGGGSWQSRSSGMEQTEVVFLGFDPHVPSRLFAGSQGVFTTDVQGGPWEKKTGPIGTVWAVAFAPSAPNVIYAGAFCTGVYKSVDGGRTWSRRINGLTVQCAEAVVVHPTNADIVYVSTNDGVFKSTDGAESWTAIDAGLSAWSSGRKDYQVLVMDPTSPETLYAGGGYGAGVTAVYKTTNGGLTWTPTGDVPFADGECYAMGLTIDPTSPNVIYLSGSGGVHRSPDGGATWTPILDKGVSRTVLVPGSGGSPAALYAGLGGESCVYRTTNGGTTWDALCTGLPRHPVLSLAVDAGRGMLYAGTQGAGVYSLVLRERTAQTITFGPLANRKYGDPDFTVSATASSGLPVTFGASGGCTVNGAAVHIAGLGSCTITAMQAGSETIAPAPAVSQSFVVAPNTATFTDSPLVPGTAVKAVHVRELRTYIDALRSGVSLLPLIWTDDPLVSGATSIKAVHVTQLRSALNEVYTKQGLTLPTYTPITSGQTIVTAAHVNEVRNAITALWGSN